MRRWQEIAEAIRQLTDDGELEIFLGDHAVGFEVRTDDEGVYITLCSDCLGEVLEDALGGAPDTAPMRRDLH